MSMNFEELGLVLREARERKGLSVTVVMEATKISRTNIEAMEGGNRSALPHPVYAKGFVKSYARYLGLDADELSMVVDREYQDEDDTPRSHGYDVAPNAEKAFQGNEKVAEGKRRTGLVLVIALLALLGVVGLLIFTLSGGKDKSAEAPVPPVVSQEEAVSSVPAQPAVEGQESVPDQPLIDESTGEQPGVGAPSPEEGPAGDPGNEADRAAANPKTAQSPPADSAGEAVPAQAEPAVSAAAAVEEENISTTDAEGEKQKYEHVVLIRAITRKGCWIGLWKGDETNMARDFVLKEGEPLRLMFNNPRRIRIGNVAGVTVVYNGKPYALDSTKGNIQTLRFGE
jgi:cytoskeleton protein RodZ